MNDIITAEKARDKFKIDPIINKIHQEITEMASRRKQLSFDVKDIPNVAIEEIEKLLKEKGFFIEYIHKNMIIKWWD